MKTYKQKLAYITIGGILMLIGMIASSVLMPSLFAERAKLGDIECTSLRVVDTDGTTRIILVPNMESINTLTDTFKLFSDRGVIIGVNKYGGRVAVSGNGGTSSIAMAIDDDLLAGITMIDKRGIIHLDPALGEE